MSRLEFNQYKNQLYILNWIQYFLAKNNNSSYRKLHKFNITLKQITELFHWNFDVQSSDFFNY